MSRRRPGAFAQTNPAQNKRSRALAASASAILAVGGIAALAAPAQAAPTFSITPDSGSAAGGTEVTVTAPAGLEFTQVSAGDNYALALTSDGRVYGWGDNFDYQMAKDRPTEATSDWIEYSPIPLTMPAGVTYTSVSAGDSHVLAIGADGNTYAWGSYSMGRLGAGAITQPTEPVLVNVPDGVTFTSVSAGNEHSLALDAAGQAYAWGGHWAGKLGNGSSSNQNEPVEVTMPAGVTFTSVAAGTHYALALGSDGNAYAWGRGGYGSLGNGDTGNRSTPTPVNMPPDVTFASIAVGGDTSLALDMDGNAWAWGYAGTGQMGDGVEGVSSVTEPVPVSMPAGVTFTDLQAGDFHVLATGADGNSYAWGSGFNGALGIGTEAHQFEPVQVTTASGVDFTQLAGGAWFSMGLDSTGKVFTWGRNRDGELGNGGTTDDVLEPAEVPGQNPELTRVTFGGEPGTDLVFDALAGTWSVTTPAHAAGAVDVELEWFLFDEPQTPLVLTHSFTYEVPATVPDSPVGLLGVGGDGEVELTWGAPDDDGGSAITDYIVEYSADGGVTWTVFDDGVGATPGAIVTGLTNGTSYLFRITAVNAVGASEVSAGTTEVTPAAASVPGDTDEPDNVDLPDAPGDTEEPDNARLPDAPGAGSGGDELAATGFESGGLLAVGLGLITAGIAVVALVRRNTMA